MSKIAKRIIISFIIILLLGFLLFKIIKVQDIILKQIYPRDYQEQVEKYAKQNNVDPLLIYSIIKAESNFNPEVVSKSNAMGLMQLMESTAVEMANKLEDPIESKDELFLPEKNIMIGTKYFAELMKRYNGNMLLALTAYNAGIGNVDEWIEDGIIRKDGSDIENIPYQETNRYVRKIVRDYKIYYRLYEENKGDNK